MKRDKKTKVSPRQGAGRSSIYGASNVLTIYPTPSHYPHKSDEESLFSDWNAISLDFRKSVQAVVDVTKNSK